MPTATRHRKWTALTPHRKWPALNAEDLSALAAPFQDLSNPQPTKVHTHDGSGANSTVVGGLAEAGPNVAIASGNNSLAAGDNAKASASGSVALGASGVAASGPQASGSAGIAIGVDYDQTGTGPRATAPGNIAIGGAGTFSGVHKDGPNAAGGRNNIAIGAAASAVGFFGDGTDMVVIGTGASSNSTGGVVIGQSASIAGNAAGNATIVGAAATSNSTSQAPTAIGNGAKAGNGGVAVGQGTDATYTAGNQRATAVGYGTVAGGDGATALGAGGTASGNYSLVVAPGATGLGGANSTASHAQAAAIGYNAVTTKANQIMLSDNARVVTHPGGVEFRVNSKTTTYTATGTDFYIPCDATSAAFTVTLPAATGTGLVLAFKKFDSTANAITISRAGSDTIDGATSFSLANQFDQLIILDRATNKWDILNSGPAGGAVTTFAAPIETTIGQPNGAGASGSAARADHQHTRNNDAALFYVESLQFGHQVNQYPAAGAVVAFANPVETIIGQPIAGGGSTSSARADHQHGRDNDAAMFYMGAFQ